MALARTERDKLSGGDEAVDARPSATSVEGGELDIVLALTDLLQDANGEVVLFNDSGLRSLALSTDALVVAEGQATRHVTAAGEDVSGFRYVAFDTGLKLFYQPGLDLILVQEAAGRG